MTGYLCVLFVGGDVILLLRHIIWQHVGLNRTREKAGEVNSTKADEICR
jgi:hypothetical protein